MRLIAIVFHYHDILQFNLRILQFPEVFVVIWFVINIDNVINSFIMKGVIESICLMRCKGSAHKNYVKKEDLMN